MSLENQNWRLLKMTAQIINFPTRPLSALELFCELPTTIKDIMIIDELLVASCEDGVYIIDEDGDYEKIEPGLIG